MHWKDPRNCLACGKNFSPKWHGTGKFCSYKCSGKRDRTGVKNSNWKGGRVDGPDGRSRVYDPSKKSPSGATSYILEYRIIAGKKLGRILRDDEIVHHIDGDPTNNDPANLEVMTQAEHAREHAEERRDPTTGRFL